MLDFLMVIPLWAAIAALAAGVGLIIVEVFLPGFGLPGLSGVVLTMAALLVMVPHIGWYTLLVGLGVLLLLLCVVLGLSRSAKRKKSRFVLSSALNQEADQPEKNEILPGMLGTALTDLHPAGMVSFAGRKADVISQGEFIPKGTQVSVMETEGNKIVVKEEKER